MPVNAKKLSFLIENAAFSYEFLNTPSAIDPDVQEVTLDLDEVTAGVLFIARKLWYVDTHQHILEAIQKGAVAILISDRSQISQEILTAEVPIILLEHEDPSLGLICARFYEQPCTQLKVYGVTGTNGKTSAITYLSELLTALGERVAVIGTVEYRFEHRRLVAANTTPDALVIQRFARQALDLGATALALEVSSHALSLDRVAGVYFDAVGFTSFGRDHLDFHGNLEEYRNAKGRLFSDFLLSSIQQGKTPLAVAHNDSEGRGMLARTPKKVHRVYCQVQAHSDQIKSHHRASVDLEKTRAHHESEKKLEHFLRLDIQGQASLEGIELTGNLMHGADVQNLSKLKVGLIGDYHPANAVIALGMLTQTHRSLLNQAWQSLQDSRGVPGRMERVRLPKGLTSEKRVALVDYAHTPDAISRAIQAIRAVHQGELSVIVGCGGNRDRGKRPAMLKAALQSADHVWLTSDNPRYEDPQQIIEDALSLIDLEPEFYAQVKNKLVATLIDRRQCIAQAWQSLAVSGALLITGKGHESYQEINGRRYRLQDHEALRAGAWATQHNVLDLNEVPFVESCLFEQRLERCTKPSLNQIVLLLREASLRQDGVIIRCLELDEQSHFLISPKNLRGTLNHPNEKTFEVNQDLVDSLWSLLKKLKPKHKEIHILVPRYSLESTFIYIQNLVSEAKLLAYPQPEIPVTKSMQGVKVQGGWSSQKAGPKIPSL
ncbi:MAG: hypothetical protein CMH49_08025 [Myxococcales bacterium]|nr:hypothetical protein [Myxococcales bacterium]